MKVVNFPLLLLVTCFVAMWLSARLGDYLRKRRPVAQDGQRQDFSVILAAVLTLLGLLIGFTFSMALSRYDQRKNYEEEEANAIGTEYLRTDLLPAAEAAKVRQLLKSYLDQRILFYNASDRQQIRQIDATIALLQNELWSTVHAGAVAQPTFAVNLAVSGMNDVLNSQGYTQAAWWNRIPAETWVLLLLIAMGSNFLIGYGAHQTSYRLFMVLPLAASVSFFLTADIENPRGGLIHVQPQNLVSLSRSLNTP